jgi:hypothetical protein
MLMLFLLALVTGAAVVALWIDVRFPRLAPRSIGGRILAVLVAVAVVTVVPVVGGSTTAAYVSLFCGVFPSFVLAFLASLWLLRGLRDFSGVR